jgi:hypothetical protein
MGSVCVMQFPKDELLPGKLAPPGYKFFRLIKDGRKSKERELYKVDRWGEKIDGPYPWKFARKAKQYKAKRDPGLPHPITELERGEGGKLLPKVAREKNGKWLEGASAQPPEAEPKRRIGIKRRHAWNRIFRKFFTPSRMEAVVDALYETATNAEDPQKIVAIKEILNRTLGKVKTTIDINENQTLTIEERKTRVLQLLGVNESDASLRFRNGQAPHELQGDVIDGALALPAEVPAGQLPVPAVGEVAPDRGDVGVGAEVGLQADHPSEAPRPPVQQQG